MYEFLFRSTIHFAGTDPFIDVPCWNVFILYKFMLNLRFYSSCGMADVMIVSLTSHSCEIGYAIGNLWSRVCY